MNGKLTQMHKRQLAQRVRPLHNGWGSRGEKVPNQAAAADDRFARWPVARARALLAAMALLLVAAALVPIRARETEVPGTNLIENLTGKQAQDRPRDDDLQLYDAVIERIARGEGYYSAAAAEHRRIGFPLRPGVAMRLPTLAYIEAWIGPTGQLVAAIVLIAAGMLEWWRRLGDETGSAQVRRIGTVLMLFGGSLGLNRYYFALHELWAGMLIALALGLHRPGRKWGAALAVAALALAIREHALPFVMLLAAMALWRRDWMEGAAWSALIVVFLVALYWHLQIVASFVQPDDPVGPSWLTFRGLSGWLSSVVLSSNLRFLPHWLAGPLTLLLLLGWASWRSPAGTTATLMFLGYGLLFMIAGRWENFYWGAVIAPVMFIGLAFLPRGVASLWRSAWPERALSR